MRNDATWFEVFFAIVLMVFLAFVLLGIYATVHFMIKYW